MYVNMWCVLCVALFVFCDVYDTVCACVVCAVSCCGCVMCCGVVSAVLHCMGSVIFKAVVCLWFCCAELCVLCDV